MRPVWLCPLRLREPRARERADVAVVPAAPGHDLRQRRLLGHRVRSRPGAADGDLNRAVEAKVTELGGHKSLYSDAYYDEATFDRLYDTANLRRASSETRPRRAADRPLREGGETTMTH